MATPTTDDALLPVTGDLATVADRLASFPSTAGVQLASYTAGEWHSAASGFADVTAGALLGDRTRFRPGSITKLLTATLVMQCVDDGLVALDDDAGALLGLRLPAGVRVGHLVSHSSGIDAGDLFVATEGDDEIESYGRLIDGTGALFEPGALFSYNNAGFVLAGMLVQRLRDATFEEVARSRVFTPVGMESSDFVAGGELVGRGAFDPSGDPQYAIGHLALPGELVRVPDQAVIDDPVCSRSLAPAGGTLVSTATDLVRFAASHLAPAATGAADLPPVLSPASAALMRALHARAPGGVTKMVGVGLGWQIWRHGDRTIGRIGGANPGQSGLVAVDPVAGTALAALTNSDQGVNLVTGLLDGFGPAAVKDDDDPPADLSVYCGTYESHAMAFAVDIDAGALGVQLVEAADMRIGATQMSTVSSAFGHTDLEAIAMTRFPLTAIDRTTFSSPMGPIAFVRESPSDEGPRWMRWRMRVLRRR